MIHKVNEVIILRRQYFFFFAIYCFEMIFFSEDIIVSILYRLMEQQNQKTNIIPVLDEDIRDYP